MSRHRNVRSMNIADEYDGYDDVYGHSVEDDFCVSPATAAQFMYNREGHDLASYIRGEDHEPEIPEEEESDQEPLADSGYFHKLQLSDLDKARLHSCLEQLQNVVGESHTEQEMVTAIISSDYDAERAINSLLGGAEAPKPQREPRANRRSRTTDDSDDEMEFSPQKNTCDNFKPSPKPMEQTMISLSALVKQHEKGAKKASEQDKPSPLQLLASKHKSETQKSSAGSSLASLAKLHEKSLKEAPPKPSDNKISLGLSLSDLARKHEQEKTQQNSSSNVVVPKLSLSELASRHSVGQSTEDQSKSESVTMEIDDDDQSLRAHDAVIGAPPGFSVKTNEKLSSVNNNIDTSSHPPAMSLFQLAAQHEHDLKNKRIHDIEKSPIKLNALTIRDSPSPTRMSSPRDSSFTPDVVELITEHSVIGQFLTTKAVIGSNTVAPPPGLRPYSSFSYDYQMRGKRRKKKEVLHEIIPFDFSTPSPDDIVKEKQKAAFSKDGASGFKVP